MKTNKKIGFYLGIGVVLILLGMIFFSTNGITDFQALKQKEHRLSVQAETEARENRKMEKEIKSLKKDIEYIKHLAKHEHEMAEPDELIFKDKSKGKDTSP